MTNRNHFTDAFEKKSSEELRTIISESDYQMEAKQAAIWELENRNEATDEDKELLNQILVNEERKRASRLSGRRYDTFLRRFVAAIIDGFALWPIAALLNYISNSNVGAIVVIGGLLNNLSPYIYSVLLHGHYGQTLGKMAMGVKVVDFVSEDDIDMRQALIRDSVPIALMIVLYAYSFIILWGMEPTDVVANFTSLIPIFIVGFLTVLWTLLEIVSMLFTEKSRAVHDLIAKTVVVRTN